MFSLYCKKVIFYRTSIKIYCIVLHCITLLPVNAVITDICNELGVSDQSHKTTRMTFNRVYSALRALENASCELTLRPIL